jgi:hypothetical protein
MPVSLACIRYPSCGRRRRGGAMAIDEVSAASTKWAIVCRKRQTFENPGDANESHRATWMTPFRYLTLTLIFTMRNMMLF